MVFWNLIAIFSYLLLRYSITYTRSNARTRGGYERADSERPGSSRINPVGITDRGQWNDLEMLPGRNSRSIPPKAKPTLGNRNKARPPDRVSPAPPEQPLPEPSRNQEFTDSLSAGDVKRKKGRKKSPVVSYRREDRGEQKRPSERKVKSEESTSSGYGSVSTGGTSDQSPSASR